MEYIWRLLTAIFLIVVAVALLVVAYVLGLNTVFAAVFVYVSLFCILFGIAKGLMVMIDYHRSQKEMQE